MEKLSCGQDLCSKSPIFEFSSIDSLWHDTINPTHKHSLVVADPAFPVNMFVDFLEMVVTAQISIDINCPRFNRTRWNSHFNSSTRRSLIASSWDHRTGSGWTWSRKTQTVLTPAFQDQVQ